MTSSMIAGFLVTYIVTLVAFLTLFHMSIMFWGIAFPFNHKKFKSLGLMKYLHVATVLVCAGDQLILLLYIYTCTCM